MGNFQNHKISPLCHLCHLNNCLHLLPCCTNEHINNLRKNRYNEEVHAIVTTLLSQPSTCHFTHPHGYKSIPPPCMDNTLPSWLFPCICYLLKCKFLTQLCPNIMCIEGTSSNRICIEFHPFQHPFANLVIQLIEFKYCNDYLSILTIA